MPAEIYVPRAKGGYLIRYVECYFYECVFQNSKALRPLNKRGDGGKLVSSVVSNE